MPMPRNQYTAQTIPYSQYQSIPTDRMPPQITPYPATKEQPKQGIQTHPQHFPATEHKPIHIPAAPTKIGRLTTEQRKEKIDRYRAKRHKRVWQKRISYTCRKRVADQRIRIKGRFVSKNEVTGAPQYEDKVDVKKDAADSDKGDAKCNGGSRGNESQEEKVEKVKDGIVRKIFNIISSN